MWIVLRLYQASLLHLFKLHIFGMMSLATYMMKIRIYNTVLDDGALSNGVHICAHTDAVHTVETIFIYNIYM